MPEKYRYKHPYTIKKQAGLPIVIDTPKGELPANNIIFIDPDMSEGHQEDLLSAAVDEVRQHTDFAKKNLPFVSQFLRIFLVKRKGSFLSYLIIALQEDTMEKLLLQLVRSAPGGINRNKMKRLYEFIMVPDPELLNEVIWFLLLQLNEFLATLEDELPSIPKVPFHKEVSVLEKRKKTAEEFRAKLQKLLACNGTEGADVASKCRKWLKNMSPKLVYEQMKLHIFGQDAALQQLSMLFYEQAVRLAYPEKKIAKNNTIILGPTGSGKTEIYRQLSDSQVLPFPIAIADCSSLSQTGFRGVSVSETMESIHQRYRRISEGGVIILDEVDKIMLPSYSQRENVHVPVMAELLKITEDGCSTFDTSKILFIGSGAFSGLKEENDSKRSIGFGASSMTGQPVSGKIFIYEALQKYGCIPELAGRFSNIIRLQPLDSECMISIAQNETIPSLHDLFASAYQIELQFSDLLVSEASTLAVESGLGVRALNAILSHAVHAAFLESGQTTGVPLEIKPIHLPLDERNSNKTAHNI